MESAATERAKLKAIGDAKSYRKYANGVSGVVEGICSRFALNAGEGARAPRVQIRLQIR